VDKKVDETDKKVSDCDKELRNIREQMTKVKDGPGKNLLRQKALRIIQRKKL